MGEEFERLNEFVAFDNFFPSWFIYYYLGLYCKYHKPLFHTSYAVLAALASIYLSILAAFWIYNNSSVANFPYTQSKFTSMLLAISIITFFYSIREEKMTRNFLARIGEMSFGIYLLHMPIKKVYELMSTKIAFLDYPLLKYLLVLLLSISILYYLGLLIPDKYMKSLGLK